MADAADARTFTPDGRYLIVRGRLWRATDPTVPAERVQQLKVDLGRARSDVARGKRTEDAELERDARRRVHAAKVALGERGPVWWTDGAPDYNRFLWKNTPYAEGATGPRAPRSVRSAVPVRPG
jgi:hypothetical protein